MSNWILTMGSARQSREFVEATLHRYNWDVQHVVEELAPWTAKSLEDLLAEAEAILSTREEGPVALFNFGRASVPYGIDTIAKCCEVLKEKFPEKLKDTRVIGPSYHAAQVFSDKWLIYETLHEAGLPLPRTIKLPLDQVEEVEQMLIAGEFPLPAIVKVTDLTGGSGMEFVQSPADLRPAVERLSSLNRDMILTQFVNGDEISFDVLRLGNETLVFPPGIKTATDTRLTHADHKIKVNGFINRMTEIEAQVTKIAELFDLQGFFSIEGVVVEFGPPTWQILEGATRVTNNFQMQNASLAFDSFDAVSRYLIGETWLPPVDQKQRLALSLPLYVHRGEESLHILQQQPWVLQAKIENLAEMPLSRDSRVRLTVKMEADQELDARLRLIEEATGDDQLSQRVFGEIERQRVQYAFVGCEEDAFQNVVKGV